jgi:hypothetical protein
MAKRNSVVALVILGLFGGCHQRQSSGLDPRIPAANPSQYEHARDWRNPKLIVLRDGITLISPAIEGGEKTVTLDHLRDSLKELPLSAWPYGRVVVWQESSLRASDDDQVIRKNWGIMLEILESMDIDGFSSLSA